MRITHTHTHTHGQMMREQNCALILNFKLCRDKAAKRRSARERMKHSQRLAKSSSCEVAGVSLLSRLSASDTLLGY